MPIGPTLQTINDSPSDKIIKENRPKKTVKDTRGRTIIYRSMSILDQARLYRAIGAPHTSNEPYMRLLNVAAMIVSIDGDIGPQPTTISFAEMRMEWLGDEGFVAVLTEVQREADESMEEAKDVNLKFREEVKN